MIAALFMVAFLAAPVGAGDAAAPARAPNVTLNVRDAELTTVLEKFATMMGVTPIISPGVRGTLTRSVSAPLPEILRDLERSFQITIRVADGRMFVSKAAATASPLDDEAADARYLADRTLPRRPASARPKPFDGAFEIRTTSGDYLTYSLASPGGISVPGCKFDLAIVPLPGDRFDGLPALVLIGDGILPRMLSPTLEDSISCELPGCPGPLSIRLAASGAGAAAPTPLSPFGVFQLGLQIIEVSAQKETILSAPRVQVAGGEAAAVQSGSTRRSPAGLLLGQSIQVAIAVVDASEKSAMVAVAASVLRDVYPKDGGPTTTIRVAHARESGRFAFGKTQRIVLAPTFGRGDSALVLEVLVERDPEKK